MKGYIINNFEVGVGHFESQQKQLVQQPQAF